MDKQSKQRLAELKELLAEGLISQTHYDNAVQTLLSQHVEIKPANKRNPIPDSEKHTLGYDQLYDGLEVGSANSRFKLIKRIGVGTYGVVWKALDLSEQRLLGGKPVKALKFLHSEIKENELHL